MPRAGAGDRRREGLGRGALAGRGLWLPQRPGDRDRADRHDRLGDGLRHHRHRARLRAGQVQEAGRRRLLQDHQPHRARGAAHARLRSRDDRRDHPLRRRPWLAGGRAGSEPRDLEAPRLRRSDPGQTRSGVGQCLRHQVRLQQVHARRGILHRGAQAAGGQARRSQLRHARRARLHPRRDRRGQYLRLRRDDARGRAQAAARASAGVRLREPVRPHRQALPLGRQPHPDDGGLAALHLGRHLQDHQHAQCGHGRGLQGRLYGFLASRAEGQRALSRWLQAQPAAPVRAARRRRRHGRGDRREADGRARRDRRRAHRRTDRPAPDASACPNGARAISRSRSSAATRSICAPANTRTAAWARSSSTCTRKAPPSAP